MIDIIICVHNAYEDVKKCIQSVRTYSDMAYRLIVVDDGSDLLTRDLLIAIKKADDDMILLRNEEGHGYTYSANMGIDASDADYLIMLNSDTVVTENWLSKLVGPLMQNESLGLTGPLSNAALWQSIPRLRGIDGGWSCNEIPENLTVNGFARLVEKHLNVGLIFVPLLNGFCLAVKRKVIDSIGKFDTQHFPKGYGEEIDFNLRAGQQGFQLAIVTACYIYHRKTRSYNNKTRLNLANLARKQLENMYGKDFNEANEIMRSNRLLAELRTKAINMAEMEGISFSSFFPESMSDILKDKIFIYGAGRRAKDCTESLKNENIDVSGYLVTSMKGNPETLMGKSVKQFDMFNKSIYAKNSYTILISVKEQSEEIKKMLLNEGYTNIVLIE